jgi:hypothetical protein
LAVKIYAHDMAEETLRERKTRERMELLSLPPEEAVKFTLRQADFPLRLQVRTISMPKPRRAFHEKTILPE